MINFYKNTISDNLLSIQDSELDSLIDSKLPTEILIRVFSSLSFEDITSTCCVTKRWSIMSLDVAQRHLNECFKPYICSIMENLKNLQCLGTMKKVEYLLMSVALRDKEIKLPKLKFFLTCTKDTLVTFLRDIGPEKLKSLIDISENVKAPFFFHDVFKTALDVNTAQVNAGERRYPVHYRGMRIGH